jgi:hypothetical protein
MIMSEANARLDSQNKNVGQKLSSTEKKIKPWITGG